MAGKVVVQDPHTLASSALLRALVERCSYGFTPEEWALAQALGPAGYVDHHLHPEAIDDSALHELIAPLGSLALSAQQIVDTYQGGFTESVPMHELKHAAVLRAVCSRRQLLERMVEFWTDHFSVRQDKEVVRYTKLVDDREVIRKHALGRFRHLLSASVHSAAMLGFLDNHMNTLAGPNENYARELMERHTLGIGGGYGENDVKQVARCLTGWRFVPWGSVPFGEFLFVESEHDQAVKHVFDTWLPENNGKGDALAVIDMLASHPSTATHVSRKLARWLLRYDPPQALVDAAVATWAATDGDLRQVVRTLLSPDALALAAPQAHPKLRRPFHFVAGLLRSVRATVDHPASYVTPASLDLELRLLGQRPFECFDAAGYPDSEAVWAGGLQPRWSFASRLLAGEIEGVHVDGVEVMQALAATGAATPGQAVNVLLGGGAFAAQDVEVLDAYAADHPPTAWPQVAELIALGAGTYSYQHY